MAKNEIQININDQKNALNKPNLLSLVEELIFILPQRSREIIRKRFGLFSDQGETLEKIGKDYKITRERVRQIIADAIKSIAKKSKNDNFLKAEEWLVFTIGEKHGIIKEEDIFSILETENSRERNALIFFARCLQKIKPIVEKGVLEKSWILSDEVVKMAKKIHLEAGNIFEKEKKPLGDEEIFEKIAINIPEIGKEKTISYLSALTGIKKNVFGRWGMAHWDEISPKGTREKIYLVLKETKKPLHFTEIAALIDRYKLGKRKAHPQTVHNELIKDSRFVLIGRGIYALKQWGYEEGTIKDVLRNILAQSAKPLHKDEILSKVLKIRKVKKTTVMINLNNEKIFQKKENLYSIRK
jgi:DNA-directed RNA polymerase delta subunit